MCVTVWKKFCPYFAHVLRLSGRLKLRMADILNPDDKISKQPKIQAVVWVLLAAFSQIYSENWEQKQSTKI